MNQHHFNNTLAEAVMPNLLIVIDNPPSYGGKMLWSTNEEYENNRLWLTRKVHEITSFEAIRWKATISELFVYAFSDVREFSNQVGYLPADHPDHTEHSFFKEVSKIRADVIIIAGRRVTHTWVERHLKHLSKPPRLIWIPPPFRCPAKHNYEIPNILKLIDDALRLCINACYAGST